MVESVTSYYNTIPTQLPRNLRDQRVLEEVVTGFCQDFGEQETRLNQLEAALATYAARTTGGAGSGLRLPRSYTNGWMFGPGIFANVASKSAQYCRGGSRHPRMMFLRALFPYPQRELPHYDQHGAPGVQPEVHRQMADYLAAGAYRGRTTIPA